MHKLVATPALSIQTGCSVRHFLCDGKTKQSFMEVTAVVLHDGALAHYDVTIGNGGVCTAYLSSYRGAGNNMPPQRVVLHKEGRNWVSDSNNNNLSEDLGYAVELKARPILQERKRQGTHPAE